MVALNINSSPILDLISKVVPIFLLNLFLNMEHPLFCTQYQNCVPCFALRVINYFYFVLKFGTYIFALDIKFVRYFAVTVIDHLYLLWNCEYPLFCAKYLFFPYFPLNVKSHPSFLYEYAISSILHSILIVSPTLDLALQIVFILFWNLKRPLFCTCQFCPLFCT